MNDIADAFYKLKIYCETEHFKGWDPYDGLNSKIFQAIPLLKKSVLCRLMVIQGFKRCPFNMRRMAFVPKEYNAKGIGLFLSGYCNLYKVVENHPQLSEKMGTLEMIKARIEELAELLISLQSKGYSGACWGYNFDWQARRLFLFPKFTPTVVATNFCAVFRPEFINRVDELIVFHPLTEVEIRAIAGMMLGQVASRLKERAIALTWDDEVVEKLAREGYDVKFGARPLRRLIQRTVEDTLSEELLGGKIALGDRVRLKVADGKITVEKEA